MWFAPRQRRRLSRRGSRDGRRTSTTRRRTPKKVKPLLPNGSRSEARAWPRRSSASMFALAGGAHGVAYPAATLYSHLGTASLHDVSAGGNGACDGDYTDCEGSLVSPLDCGANTWICNATKGYDGPTGVGTPNGLTAFKPGSSSTSQGGEGEPKTNPPEEPPGQGQGSEVGGTKTGEGPGVQPLGGSVSGSTNSGQDNKSSGTQGGSISGASARSAARVIALALTANARAAVSARHVASRPTCAFHCE